MKYTLAAVLTLLSVQPAFSCDSFAMMNAISATVNQVASDANQPSFGYTGATGDGLGNYTVMFAILDSKKAPVQLGVVVANEKTCQVKVLQQDNELNIQLTR